jgi:hypothetical protein
MIQRYDLSSHWGMSEQDDGDYVLYTDHLAEVEQWKRIIVTHVDVIAEKDEALKIANGGIRTLDELMERKDKQIATLQAELTTRIKKLEAALTYCIVAIPHQGIDRDIREEIIDLLTPYATYDIIFTNNGAKP